MSLLLLLRPKYPEPTGSLPKKRNHQPWLSFPKNQPLRQPGDDDEVLVLIAL